ncbi:hypothetical protein Q9Q99_15640 [Curtobacterium flaccumfaciens]|nr:hypothetical protein Q9Q99_15640 [Curtobacterium flaccumfaciens]
MSMLEFHVKFVPEEQEVNETGASKDTFVPTCRHCPPGEITFPVVAGNVQVDAAARALAYESNDLVFPAASTAKERAPRVKTNFPVRVLCVDAPARTDSDTEAEAEAAGRPNERPETMVAAASPAAPMDLRAVDALFL